MVLETASTALSEREAMNIRRYVVLWVWKWVSLLGHTLTVANQYNPQTTSISKRNKKPFTVKRFQLLMHIPRKEVSDLSP